MCFLTGIEGTGGVGGDIIYFLRICGEGIGGMFFFDIFLLGVGGGRF